MNILKDLALITVICGSIGLLGSYIGGFWGLIVTVPTSIFIGWKVGGRRS